jgi:hypothetical protein
VTTVIFSNEVCSTFTAMSSQNLLSDHVFPVYGISLHVGKLNQDFTVSAHEMPYNHHNHYE